MKDLSITQKYYLCAFNEKGKAPLFTNEDVMASLITAGIIELNAQGLITQEEKQRFTIAKPWDESLTHLEPLYQAIATFKKPCNPTDVLGYYYLQLTEKRLRALLASIGTSLVDAQLADELPNQGLLSKTTKYAPKPEATAEVMNSIRDEVLGDEPITDETARLLFLLKCSGSLNKHFSKEERPTLKARLKEVEKSEATAQAEAIIANMGNLLLIIIMFIVLMVVIIGITTTSLI